MPTSASSRMGALAVQTKRRVFPAVGYVSFHVTILMWRLLQVLTYVLWILLRETFSFIFKTLLTKSEVKLVDSISASIEGPCSGANVEVAAVEAIAASRSSQDAIVEDIIESPTTSADALMEAGEQDDFILRFLRFPHALVSEEAEGVGRRLETIVDQVRVARGVRISVEADRDPASVAVLGQRSSVREACEAFVEEAHVDSNEEERCAHHFFLVHFTMRETWDLPQDDELADASVGSDWIDLGSEGDLSCPAMERDDDIAQLVQPSAQSVLRQRLHEALADQQDLYVFMDEDPFNPSATGAVHVDFVGRLPSAWDSARSAILACEARGVYLSHRFEVRFWPPPELREALRDQVKNAVSHCQDASESTAKGGVGLVGNGVSAFEALADNVSAILHGCSPPGWHRLEWTPHGTAAVPCHTY